MKRVTINNCGNNGNNCAEWRGWQWQRWFNISQPRLLWCLHSIHHVDIDDNYDEGGDRCDDEGGDESDGSLWSFCLRGNQFFPPERSLWYVPTHVPTHSKVINQTNYLNRDELMMMICSHKSQLWPNFTMQKNYEDDADDQIEDISSCALEPLSRYRNFHPPWISPHEYLRPIGHILSDDDCNEDEYFEVTWSHVEWR